MYRKKAIYWLFHTSCCGGKLKQQGLKGLNVGLPNHQVTYSKIEHATSLPFGCKIDFIRVDREVNVSIWCCYESGACYGQSQCKMGRSHKQL